MDIREEITEQSAELERLKECWAEEQRLLLKKLVVDDALQWGRKGAVTLKRVGGVDISFVKGDLETACSALVVVSYPELDVLYEEYRMIKLTQPYIVGFLAFREVSFLVDMLRTLKETKPHLYPEVVLVDGNGMLHPRGFGLACHLGVICDIPTIGIGKNFLQIDGMETSEIKAAFESKCKVAGDSLPLVGKSGQCWGVALKPTDKIKKPVYISIGHRLSLQSSIDIVMAVSQYRLPEPIRFADQRSREFLRKQGYNNE